MANVPFYSRMLPPGDRTQVSFWDHENVWKRLRRTGRCAELELVTHLLPLPSVPVYSAGIWADL